MTGSSALMAIGHILMCYTLFFSFHANKALGYGATMVESNKSHAPPSCSGTTTGLRVVHKYGPCSPSGLKKTSAVASQILAKDKLRVRAINSRLHNRRTIGLEGQGTTDTYLQNDLPGAGTFWVSVGFGTPLKDFNLVLDTGSYVTWVQCEPCTESPCPQQQNPSLYYPSFSSTSSNAPCSPLCNYTQAYFDKSTSGGVFVLDTVSIGQDYQIPEFIFLCADKKIGDFDGAHGILGLGPASSGDEFANYSLATQTANLFGRVFCHCLPSSGNSGYVYFGEKAREQCPFSGTYTRLLRNPVFGASYYFVNLIAITLGQKKVEVPSGIFSSSQGTIIDSGTVITHLPFSVYSELSQEFDRLMSEFPPANPSDDGVLKACYNLADQDNLAIPEMVLHFENLDVNLDQTAVTWKGNDNMSQVCFAFAAKEDEEDVTIIGNHQQQKLNMLFNIPDQRLEIGPERKDPFSLGPQTITLRWRNKPQVSLKPQTVRFRGHSGYSHITPAFYMGNPLTPYPAMIQHDRTRLDHDAKQVEMH
ncbi:hypothetical protein CXB51_012873 [Gossypium anomalum]|uniref:Peptidase A1 domain-containing protein n=1 Tax=Gossypium anomalum TaxID=47600 RepID=A0A8J5YRV8_9ROSI|nr:hypothetical protein CXB51_012873 [Gossypium anomalum]